MIKILFKYFFEEDTLYIQIGSKKSYIGDDEFQDGVTIFRDPRNKKKIVGIEILNFSYFKTKKIKTSKEKTVDFSEPFQILKEFRTVAELRNSYPELFEQYLRDSGFKLVNEDKSETDLPIEIKFSSNEIPDLCTDI